MEEMGKIACVQIGRIEKGNGRDGKNSYRLVG